MSLTCTCCCHCTPAMSSSRSSSQLFLFFLITKPLFFYKLISYAGKTTRPARACTHLQVAFYFTYYIYIGLYSVDALYMPPSPLTYIYIFFSFPRVMVIISYGGRRHGHDMVRHWQGKKIKQGGHNLLVLFIII